MICLLELGGFIKYIRLFLKMVLKVKVVKFVRNLVDLFFDMEVLIGMEVEIVVYYWFKK